MKLREEQVEKKKRVVFVLFLNSGGVFFSKKGDLEPDPEMGELAAKMRRERKQARQKQIGGSAPGAPDAGPTLDGEIAVVSKKGADVSLPVAAVSAVFEGDKKPKRALKKDWATAE